ncbi:hypothetical protein VPH35_051331 [Triticum aestivum]
MAAEMGDSEGNSTTFLAWPSSTGRIMRQHSMEYWMMASLQQQQQQGGAARPWVSEAVRVRDPDAVDAFFVPFSSLSFNVHGRNMTDPDTEADRLLQVADAPPHSLITLLLLVALSFGLEWIISALIETSLL